MAGNRTSLEVSAHSMEKRESGEANTAQQPSERGRVESPLRIALRALLFAVLLWIAWSAVFIFYSSPDHVTITVGEPSPRDIKAPRQVTYVSEVKTTEGRLAAAARVDEIYSGTDMRIVAEQLTSLRGMTESIGFIRQTAGSTQSAKVERLQAISKLSFSEDLAREILALSETEWDEIVLEASRALDLSMRQEIRNSQVATVRRRAERLISFDVPDELRVIVLALTQHLIVANSFYDAEQTNASRDAARDAVEPVNWTIRAGESILREGEIATDLALEKLQILGLLDTDLDWLESLGTMLLMAAIVAILSAYVARNNPLLLKRPRREALFVLILLIIGITARLSIPGRTLIPYLFPTAAAAMLVAILLDMQMALLVSVISAIMVGLSAGNSIELFVYALLGGTTGALAIWRMEQLGAFVRTTVYVALVNMAVILGFRLYTQMYDAVALLQLLAAGFANAVLCSSLTFVAFSFIGRLFGIATSLQLLELARPTHPLFRQLLMKAPGTYHHSIVISNMAERAAESIGADALLSRVGSYYHDIGKTIRPYFFAENQSDGVNPHDKLDPRTSTEVIISHTAEGLALARKYRIPDKVRAFIPEHHGTTLVTYFYRRASQESDEEITESDFSYPGPKPQSKETAIVMLADSIEAVVRSSHPANQVETERIIRQVINDRLISGQLDECDLSLKDLGMIREAFVSVLQGVFHPRIQYPERNLRRNQRATERPPVEA